MKTTDGAEALLWRGLKAGGRRATARESKLTSGLLGPPLARFSEAAAAEYAAFPFADPPPDPRFDRPARVVFERALLMGGEILSGARKGCVIPPHVLEDLARQLKGGAVSFYEHGSGGAGRRPLGAAFDLSEEYGALTGAFALDVGHPKAAEVLRSIETQGELPPLGFSLAGCRSSWEDGECAWIEAPRGRCSFDVCRDTRTTRGGLLLPPDDDDDDPGEW